jgi:hypothetical protein
MGESKTLDQPVSSVKLDVRTGEVEVTGQAGATRTTVVRTIKYRGQQPGRQDTYRVDGGVLTLTGDCGDDCEVDYAVTVPAGMTVSGATTTGRVALHNVGAVDVKTGTGVIELADVAGPVRAETNTGSIHGTRLRGGAVQATANTGEIELTLAEADNVTANTAVGHITLSVPSSGTYRVSGHTGTGHREIGVDDSASGQYSLDLNSGTGSVEVTRA